MTLHHLISRLLCFQGVVSKAPGTQQIHTSSCLWPWSCLFSGRSLLTSVSCLPLLVHPHLLSLPHLFSLSLPPVSLFFLSPSFFGCHFSFVNSPLTVTINHDTNMFSIYRNKSNLCPIIFNIKETKSLVSLSLKVSPTIWKSTFLIIFTISIFRQRHQCS